MSARNLTCRYSAALSLITAAIVLGLRGTDLRVFKSLPPIITSEAYSEWQNQPLSALDKIDVTIKDEIRLIDDPFDRPNILVMQLFPRGQLVFSGWTDGAYNDFATYLQLQRINSFFVKERKILTLEKKVTHQKSKKESFVSDSSLFDPQFSPDGKYILFKFGHIFQPNYFRVYVYDLQLQLSYLTEQEFLNYDSISWSPDSKYIALAKGGGDDPRSSNPSIPYELYVINWRTGKSYPVVKSTSIQARWSWIAPHTLIYGSLPADVDHDLKYIGQNMPYFWQRLTHDGKRFVQPNIYSYSVENTGPKLIVKNGFLPAVSPDAKHIAYFQLINREDISKFPGGDASYSVRSKLVMAALDKSTFSVGKPIPLHPYSAPCPQLVWVNDEQLLVLHEKEFPAKRYSLDIDEWNVQQKSSRHLTTITASKDDWQKGFQTIFLSPTLNLNAHTMMLTINDYYPTPHGGVSSMDTLKEIDLQTGNVTTVATIRPSLGSTWSYSLPG